MKNKSDRKITVESESDDVCLIVEYPTGVVYSHQSGGYACLQNTLEGFMLPLDSATDLLERSLHEYFFVHDKYQGTCFRGLDDEDANFLDQLFLQYYCTEILLVNRSKLNKSMEAWVYVSFLKSNDKERLGNHIPDSANMVLVWNNSD